MSQMTKADIKIIGCGYIGKKVASNLNKINRKPVCFVKTAHSKSECESLGYKAIRFNLDHESLDLADEIKNGFSKSQIAYFAPPPPAGKIDTRIAHFISALESLDLPPEKIVLISTTGVYGDCHGEWIDESRPLNPQVDRAYRRVDAEEQLKAYCEKAQVSLIVLRVPGIYAEDKLPLKRITSGEPIVNAQDSGFTNRIHAEDLAAFCLEAIVCDVETGVYNCCDGHPSTMNDYFMKVADTLGFDRPVEISMKQAKRELSKGMLSYLAESKRISNKKLLDKFETQLTYPDLEAGLKNTGLNNE